jgi:hypothetical protein
MQDAGAGRTLFSCLAFCAHHSAPQSFSVELQAIDFITSTHCDHNLSLITASFYKACLDLAQDAVSNLPGYENYVLTEISTVLSLES